MRHTTILFAALVGSAAHLYAAPTVSSVVPTPNTGVGALATVSVTFSEPVTGVDAGALSVAGVAPATVTGTGAGPYVFSFTQPRAGTVSVSWDLDNTIAGIGSGAFVAGAAWSYQLADTIAPTLGQVMTSVAGQEMPAVHPAQGSTVGRLTQASVTFSEAVTGVGAGDLLVNGVAAATITGADAGPYVFSFPQPTDGVVNFSWAGGHGIVDSVGNAFVPSPWMVTKAASAGTLVISEFLADNAGVTVAAGSDLDGTRDENFDLSGWIEITNTGTGAVNLTGWSLTDDYEPASGATPAAWRSPQQWVFRGGSLAAGARLVVWASGKDRKPATGHQHTNFSLASSGGSLALFPPDSPSQIPAAAFVQYPVQRFDYSYGAQAGDGALRYFTPPSVSQTSYALPTSAAPLPTAPAVPGGVANGSSNLTGVTADPTANVNRGFFDQPFSVTLSGPAGAEIFYTLDGSRPSFATTLYGGPLTISGTTVLRFIAVASGRLPSNPVTQSYLFLDQVVSQPSPPYNNPAITTDEANPSAPSVGNTVLPVNWGSGKVGFSAANTLPLPAGSFNLTAGQAPADYGMDVKISGDPTLYDDTGAANPATGKTNLTRIKAALRALPSLSLVLRPADMFGSGAASGNTGLYPQSSESNKPDLTKPCSLELLMPDGSTVFNLEAGVDLHGNASREPSKNPKHGFTLRFKGRYGVGKLAASLFPESPVREWDKMVLRADFNSAWTHWSEFQRTLGTRVRDAWSKDTFRDMGRIAGHNRYVALYINGLFWGTYDLAEDQAQDFSAAYFGGDKGDQDIVEQGVLKNGTWTAYSALKSIIGWSGGTVNGDRPTAPTATVFGQAFSDAQMESLKQYLDVPWFIDYMLLHLYLGHQDWATTYDKNWYATRTKNGTFKYLPWDQENIMWGPGDNRVTAMSPALGALPTLFPPTAIHPRLFSNAEYKLAFADRVHRHFVRPGGALTPTENQTRFNKWTAIMNADAMCLESARWGDYRARVHNQGTAPFDLYTWNGKYFENGTVVTQAVPTFNWLTEINRLKNSYFPARTTTVIGQFRTTGLYPSLNAPEMRNASDSLRVGDSTVSAGYQLALVLPMPAPSGTTSAGTIYYTTNGVDPRVAYTTTGERTTEAVAYSTPITMNQSQTVKARTLNGVGWSALMEASFQVGPPLPSVRITEIHYRPRGVDGGAASEFIEIQNTGLADVDVGNWSIEGVEFIFPMGMTLPAGARVVIASNNAPTVFSAQYPGVIIAGTFGGSLDNGGERITLRDRRKRRVDSVEYGDAAPWPVGPDGGGPSLERVVAEGDSQAAWLWQASAVNKGTPGSANGVISTAVVLNEVRAGSGDSDFVELKNTGAGAVDLSNWSVVVDTDPQRVLLAGVTALAPGAVVSISVTTQSGAGLRLAAVMAREGGGVFLVDSSGRTVDGLRYGPQNAQLSMSRTMAREWEAATPTPGLANMPTPTGAVTNLKLNEWMANPLPGEQDWIELHNLSSNQSVLVTGAIIEVNGASARMHSPSVISPAGFARYYLNEGGTLSNAIGLSLPAAAATLVLRGPSGELLDSRVIGTAAEGVSSGRQPDGTGNDQALASPSPNFTNAPTSSSVVLNEILFENTLLAPAPWGRRPAWVELHNPGAATVDLSNWTLGDSADGNGSWRFPSGVSLSAGQFLRLWCDPSQAASFAAGSDMNTRLAVHKDGTIFGLALRNVSGQLVDRVQWGLQIPNQSIGRANGTWQLLLLPTPSGANSAPATLGPAAALFLNEWLSSAASTLQNEFVELYNSSTLPANVGGLWLGDEPSVTGRQKWRIPALSFIAAKGHGVFSSGAALPGAPVLGFELSGGGEHLRLSAEGAATTPLDNIGFSALLVGRSAGRLPDGAALQNALSPTPGRTNSNTAGPVFLRQPQNMSAPAATNLRLEVSTLDANTWQWSKDGVPISGATQPILDLPAVTFASDGIYHCTATGPSGSATSQTAIVSIVYSYAAWAARFGGIPAGGDSDQDGFANRIEFLMGTNPLSSASLPGSTASFNSATQTFTSVFPLSLSAHHQSVVGQLSPDLDSWTAQTPLSLQTIAPTSGSTIMQSMQFLVPAGSPRHFMRLQITE